MTLNASTQLTLDFTPGLTERHSSLMDCVRECAYTNRNPLKTIAADMDLSQSELSRKLADNPEDKRKFSIEDLESFINATGDTTPIYYLIEKYLQDEDAKRQHALTALVKVMPDLMAILKQASH